MSGGSEPRRPVASDLTQLLELMSVRSAIAGTAPLPPELQRQAGVPVDPATPSSVENRPGTGPSSIAWRAPEAPATTGIEGVDQGELGEPSQQWGAVVDDTAAELDTTSPDLTDAAAAEPDAIEPAEPPEPLGAVNFGATELRRTNGDATALPDIEQPSSEDEAEEPGSEPAAAAFVDTEVLDSGAVSEASPNETGIAETEEPDAEPPMTELTAPEAGETDTGIGETTAGLEGAGAESPDFEPSLGTAAPAVGEPEEPNAEPAGDLAADREEHEPAPTESGFAAAGWPGSQQPSYASTEIEDTTGQPVEVEVTEITEVDAVPVAEAEPEPVAETGLPGAVTPDAPSSGELSQALSDAGRPGLAVPNASLTEPPFALQPEPPRRRSRAERIRMADEPAATGQPTFGGALASASRALEPEAPETIEAVEQEEPAPGQPNMPVVGNVKVEAIAGPRKGAKFLGKSSLAGAAGLYCAMDRFDLPEGTHVKLSLIAPRFADQIDVEDAIVAGAAQTEDRKIQVALGFETLHEELEQFIQRYFTPKPASSGGGFFSRFRR